MKTGSESLYLDSSALVKIYHQESESAVLESFLAGRDHLLVSDLGLTEVTSAISRHVREGRLSPGDGKKIHVALLRDMEDGVFQRVESGAPIHRRAEEFLLTLAFKVRLRSADAIHLAHALDADAKVMVTYDRTLAKAAAATGRLVIYPGP